MSELSNKVARLEDKYDKIKYLCGTIISTLRINRDRKTLFAKDSEGDKQLDEMITSWREQMDKLIDNA